MQTALGILGCIALVAVVYGIRRAIARGSAVATGALTGNTRARGLAAVQSRVEFSAPVTGSEIVERVRYTLDLGQGYVNGLKLGGMAKDGSALLIVGRNGLEFAIDTEPAETGCTGWATAVLWREREGRVTETESVERILKHIRAAVEHFGGTSQQ